MRVCGVRACAAKVRVSPTVRLGKCTSTVRTLRSVRYTELTSLRTLRIVDRLAAELLVHTIERNPLVVDAAFVLDEKSIVLARDGLEQGRATGTGATENDEHLALAKDAVKVAQDVDALTRTSPEQAANVAWQSSNHIHDVLLVVRSVAIAVDILKQYMSRSVLSQ